MRIHGEEKLNTKEHAGSKQLSMDWVEREERQSPGMEGHF